MFLPWELSAIRSEMRQHIVHKDEVIVKEVEVVVKISSSGVLSA